MSTSAASARLMRAPKLPYPPSTSVLIRPRCPLAMVGSSVRPAALLVLLPAAAGAGSVPPRPVIAPDRRARRQRLHPVVVEVGHHPGDVDDDPQAFAVIDRHRRRGRVVGVGGFA